MAVYAAFFSDITQSFYSLTSLLRYWRSIHILTLRTSIPHSFYWRQSLIILQLSLALGLSSSAFVDHGLGLQNAPQFPASLCFYPHYFSSPSDLPSSSHSNTAQQCEPHVGRQFFLCCLKEPLDQVRHC